MPAPPAANPATPPNPAPPPIPAEEEAQLRRVSQSLEAQATAGPGTRTAYDRELMALRDEVAEARLEDVPALIAQMERLEGVSLQRAEARALLVERGSPYFAHLRLRERTARGEVVRDVFVGRATYVDPVTRVNIVDWRNAPVSQLYYRYEEGSDYEERFGERDVEGEILVRRTVTIEEGELVRVAAPQGTWTKTGDGWHAIETRLSHLRGGQGTAARVPDPRTRGVLGAGGTARQRLDRHLPEIAALIDPRQFELIARPSAGVVVVQGGAGSGKTTIGLHRIAYLAFADQKRFRPERMLVVTAGPGLAAYIGEVLPALGVRGVKVQTLAEFAVRELRRLLPELKAEVVESASAAVTRVKNHPALLRELERRARALADARPKGRKPSRKAVVDLWAELITDAAALHALLTTDPTRPLSDTEVREAHELALEQVRPVLEREPDDEGAGLEGASHAPPRKAPKDERRHRARLKEHAELEDAAGQRLPTRLPSHERVDADQGGDEDVRGHTGIDGAATVDEQIRLHAEDVAMLLRIDQLARRTPGPYEHLFVDEAQDLSALELAALLGQTSRERSVTLAGDTAQRLSLDGGFGDWRGVLQDLGLGHVAIEPLRVAYRSTREILELARFAMGPLAPPEAPEAKRTGAPVEVHRFPGVGAAVAFLAEALRPLFAEESRATVALLARHAELADRYFEGLRRAEVPSLRRVRGQDFSFRPGVEVTEIRQAKGLEFDYVVLLDVNAGVFGSDDESRHLLHIGATRAAHQLWLVVTGRPSPLLPEALLRFG